MTQEIDVGWTSGTISMDDHSLGKQGDVCCVIKTMGPTRYQG
jgi:hypothetical protein